MRSSKFIVTNFCSKLVYDYVLENFSCSFFCRLLLQQKLFCVPITKETQISRWTNAKLFTEMQKAANNYWLINLFINVGLRYVVKRKRSNFKQRLGCKNKLCLKVFLCFRQNKNIFQLKMTQTKYSQKVQRKWPSQILFHTNKLKFEFIFLH